MQKLQQSMRMLDRLPAMGMEVKYEWPNRYSVEEGKTWVLGQTFPVKDLMRKHGFRWTSGKFGKAWMMPAQEFAEVGNKWLGEVIRELDGGKKPAKTDPDARAMFSEMSDRDLTKYLQPLVDADMEANEYYDGEQTSAQVMARMKLRLKRMTPAEQEAIYLKNQKGQLRPRWASEHLAGDANVALASVLYNAQRGFLEDVVTAIIRYSGKGTPVQGKPGGQQWQRGVATGMIENRGDFGGTLSIEAEVKHGKIVIRLNDMAGQNEHKSSFSDHETPASIAATLSTVGRSYLIDG